MIVIVQRQKLRSAQAFEELLRKFAAMIRMHGKMPDHCSSISVPPPLDVPALRVDRILRLPRLLTRTRTFDRSSDLPIEIRAAGPSEPDPMIVTLDVDER